MPQAAPKSSSYGMQRRLNAAKMHEFSVVYSFVHGYRNREEVTMLPPGVLVEGSQNVLTQTSGRVGVAQGYALDGSASVVLAPINSGITWRTSKGAERNLRAGFLTTAGNDGKLQFRYVDSNGNVVWTDLLTGLTSTDFVFADYWDSGSEKIAELLSVNGGTNIYEWSGAEAAYASATTNTIVVSNTDSIAELGFYLSSTSAVTLGGTNYTYTGVSGHTFTGVTPDPTGASHAVGDLLFQTIKATPVTSVVALGLSTVSVIGISLNQVYYGQETRNDVYVSKVGNYKSCAFTSAGRVPGEGAVLNLGTPLVGFAPQESQMYITAGLDQWYLTEFKLSADLASESLNIAPLKTGARQAAQSQDFITKDKNSIIFLSNEPTVSSLGLVANILSTPQITDISFPIINDMNGYDFTDGSVYYWKNFILVAVPKHSLVRIYNMTDPKAHYWEAPLQYPVTGFYEVAGELYGHGYLTSESYKLLTGYNFRGQPIKAIAKFSYQQYGSRFSSKAFDEFYQEGRCTQNGTLVTGIVYETDGFATETDYEMAGNDTTFVAVPKDDNSLGKFSLGKQPLGGDIDQAPADPPKFRKITTFPKTSFYEQQVQFSSFDKDFNWSIICFGPNVSPTAEGNNNITR